MHRHRCPVDFFQVLAKSEQVIERETAKNGRF